MTTGRLTEALVVAVADVTAARRDMEDAAFRRNRMQEAVRRLGERLREVKAQEEPQRMSFGGKDGVIGRQLVDS